LTQINSIRGREAAGALTLETNSAQAPPRRAILICVNRLIAAFDRALRRCPNPCRRRISVTWSRILRVIAIAALSAVAIHAAAADDAGQVAHGHQLALEICSACHVAGPDQKTPPILEKPAPSLASIANRTGTTAASIEKFLLTIHLSLANGKDMPNPELREDQARDLAAYVMSLRKVKE
jgi:mono/diheme cytochrome c family protein